MRIRSQSALAMMMLATCVVIGLMADEARREAIGWFARDGGASSSRLQLAFQSWPHVMRIRNLTADTWSACVVTLDGGYVSPSVPIGPGSVTNIPYKVFATGGDALNDVDGFGRAFRSTAVECADAGQRREFSVLR